MAEACRRLAGDRTLRRLAALLGRETAWVTGGYVRDRLLGGRPDEVDLVIHGTVESAGGAARAIAEDLGVGPHLVGRAPRAVWRIETPALKVEIWPLGELTLREDALRRDFTVNALQWRLPGGPLKDPARGLPDLRARLLRAISRENLAGDPVRILRAVRLTAQLPGFALEEHTGAMVRDLAPVIATAPRERVGHELLRLLEGPAPSLGLALLIRLGLLEPSAPPGAKVQPEMLVRLCPAAHLLRCRTRGLPRLRGPQATAARLAVLLAAWGPVKEAHLAAHAWPGTERRMARSAAVALPHLLREVSGPPATRRETMALLGEAFPAALALSAAAALVSGLPGGPWQRWWRQWRRTGRRLLTTPPLLRGGEIMAITGLPPGPRLGRLVTELERARIRGDVRSPGGARRWLERRMVARVGMMGPGNEGEE